METTAEVLALLEKLQAAGGEIWVREGEMSAVVRPDIAKAAIKAKLIEPVEQSGWSAEEGLRITWAGIAALKQPGTTP